MVPKSLEVMIMVIRKVGQLSIIKGSEVATIMLIIVMMKMVMLMYRRMRMIRIMVKILRRSRRRRG